MLAPGDPETLGHLSQQPLKLYRVDTVRLHHGPDNGIGQNPLERRFAMTIHRWTPSREQERTLSRSPSRAPPAAEKACPAQDLRIDCSDLAVELTAPVRGDADVRQHTIVELLELANITANASLSGWATCQPDDNAEPFRKRAQDAAHAGPDDDTTLDAGLPLDFERQLRDGIVFLGHSKLLRGRARRMRWHDRGSGVEAARRWITHTAAARDS